MYGVPNVLEVENERRGAPGDDVTFKSAAAVNSLLAELCDLRCILW